MAREAAEWSRDVCTCGHPDTGHDPITGACSACAAAVAWSTSRSPTTTVCRRFQWDGKPRVRVW